MVIFLLIVIVLLLMFGPGLVKAWAGGALVVGLFLAVIFVDGVAASLFSNIWLLLILGGCGVAIYFQGWGKSWEQFVGRADEDTKRR